MNYTKQIIMATCTTVSIISPFLSAVMPLWITIVIVIIGLACFAFLMYDSIASNALNERICKSNPEIEEAMKDIIRSNGKICIMSRDLSWVTDEIALCLANKKSDVLIFAQSPNDRTDALTKEGVCVKFYSHLNYEPLTRFTIIRYNKSDSQVAIAKVQNTVRKKKKFRHTIYQTSSRGDSRDEWINSLATDMVKLCNAVCEENNDVEKD